MRKPIEDLRRSSMGQRNQEAGCDNSVSSSRQFGADKGTVAESVQTKRMREYVFVPRPALIRPAGPRSCKRFSGVRSVLDQGLIGLIGKLVRTIS
jgi:hypothetical protein